VNLIFDYNNPKNWNGDVLITNKNGQIIIYNIMNERIKWISNPSHQDTIFDTKINSKYLCSCSFLGELKVFNI